jgi:drug/metabolite transporter (DMT)-like permease
VLATTALLIVTIAWGTTYVMSQTLVRSMPVSSFLFWRFAIATCALVALAPRSVRKLSRQEVSRASVVGFALAAGFALQTSGLRLTSATSSGFVTGMFVVLTPIVAAIAFRDRISPRVWAGMALSAFGLAVLSLDGLSLQPGDALTLGGALAFAVQIAALSRWSTAETAVGMATIQLGIVAMASLLAALTVDGHVVAPADATTWLTIGFLSIVASALAYTVQTWSQAHLSATRGAVIISTETAWAALTGVLIAHDPITARLLAGGALLLLAIAVVQVPRPRIAIARGSGHLRPAL